MSHTIRSPSIETRSARLKLTPRLRPYWSKIAPGIALGYRTGKRGGSWNVRCADGKGSRWTKLIGHADDYEDANGVLILSYTQAMDKARQLARGGETVDPQAGTRPATLAEALTDYRADLTSRRQAPENADYVRCHISSTMLSKPVTMLTVRELRQWRDGLLGKMAPASVNRRSNALKAALNHAAKLDTRIDNISAWRYGLTVVPIGAVPEIGSNILSDDQRAALITAAYRHSDDLGLLVELHDATGMRTSQIRLITMGNLHGGRDPVLDVPSSLKGKNRTQRRMIPLPISADLAARIRGLGRGNGDLLVHVDADPIKRFRRVVTAAGLDPTVISLYAFRHTKITRSLLRNLPIRLVAATFDTSVAMIERTYSKFIVHQANDALRAALVGDGVGATGNVIPLRR